MYSVPLPRLMRGIPAPCQTAPRRSVQGVICLMRRRSWLVQESAECRAWISFELLARMINKTSEVHSSGPSRSTKTLGVKSVHKVSMAGPVGLLFQRQRVIPLRASRAQHGEKSRHAVLLSHSNNSQGSRSTANTVSAQGCSEASWALALDTEAGTPLWRPEQSSLRAAEMSFSTYVPPAASSALM